jgi:hypothetical protein
MQVDMHAHAHTFTHTLTPPSCSRGNLGRARKVPQVHAHSVTSTRADSDAIFVVERQIIGPGPAALGHGGIDALFVTLSVHAHEHVPHRLHLAVQHRHLRQTTSRSARNDTHTRDAQEGRTLRSVHTLCTPPHGPGIFRARHGGRRQRPGVSPRPASATAVCCRGRPCCVRALHGRRALPQSHRQSPFTLCCACPRSLLSQAGARTLVLPSVLKRLDRLMRASVSGSIGPG